LRIWLECVESSLPKERFSRDRKDDRILNGARQALVDILLTGDKDLLVLKIHEQIPIIAPREFWRLIAE
jgi:predicted nucleic acid-binding protein